MAAAEAQVFRTAVQSSRRMQRTRTGSSRAVSSSSPLGRTERAERIGLCLAVPQKLWYNTGDAEQEASAWSSTAW